jgi:hypothetical protein
MPEIKPEKIYKTFSQNTETNRGIKDSNALRKIKN